MARSGTFSVISRSLSWGHPCGFLRGFLGIGFTYRWEKILTNPTSDRGLISKIHKELKKLNIKIPNNTIKRWGTDLNREFSTEYSQMAKGQRIAIYP